MSDFVHSNMPATVRFAKFEGKPKIKPQERPEFRRKDFILLLNAFRALNTSMLLILLDTFQEDLIKETKDIVISFIKEEQKELGLH